MVIDRNSVIADLRACVVEVYFKKVDGTMRKLHGTLRPDFMPQEHTLEEQTKEKGYHRENPEVIACYDVINRGWRSFRIDSVEYCSDVTDKYA